MLWIIPIPQNLIFLFYFESKGIIFLAHLATDFLHEMKTATWDNFTFFILMERCFCLLLCNLFHKAAFLNFMFPEHCHITLLGPNCKTSLEYSIPWKDIFTVMLVICVLSAVSRIWMFPRICSETLFRLELEMLLIDQ